MVKKIYLEVSDILYGEIEEAMVNDRFEDRSEFLRQCIRMYLGKSLGKRKDKTKEKARLDKDVSSTAIPQRDKELAKSVRDVIREVQQRNEGKAPKQEVIQYCLDLGIDKEKIDGEIKRLKNEGAIFEPLNGFLKST